MADIYYLLTGGTGLLGRFILFELLRRQLSVAVCVRASSHEMACRRIEQALRPFEEHGYLPRPLVIPCDLRQPELGLDLQDEHFLQSQPCRLIHSAASIRFSSEPKTGEPYRTNVDGTRNLIQLCKRLHIDAVHHISTAYVGARNEAAEVPEQAYYSLQQGGNDYERSKIGAENLMLESFAGKLAIHRPSIVVGDSRSGLTSTFHGFYTPLQIGFEIAKAHGFDSTAGNWFQHQLGLGAEDRKNLVPVDWVAACIARVAADGSANAANEITAPAAVYHWTHPQPVTCGTLQRAITSTIEKRLTKSGAAQTTSSTGLVAPQAEAFGGIGEQFAAGMSVYHTYFRNDPTFDRRAAEAACPDLPCPPLDLQRLQNLADYAIEANFGWPREELPELPHRSLAIALRSYPVLDASAAGLRRLRVTLLGGGAPEPLLYAEHQGRWHSIRTSAENETTGVPTAGSTELRCVLPMELLAGCISGKTAISAALTAGRCVLEGAAPGGEEAMMERWLQDLKDRLSKSAH